MTRRGAVGLLSPLVLLIAAACNIDASGLNRDVTSTDDGVTGTTTTTSTSGTSTSDGGMTGSTSSTGSTTEAADATTTTSGTAESSTGEEPIVCGVSAPTSGSCDEMCDDCMSGTCAIDCMGGCPETTILCPAGAPCAVACNGPSACEGKTITCPPDHECNVSCFGSRSCAGLVLECGAGTCAIECNTFADACDGLQFHCGANEGLIECNTAQTTAPEPIPAQPATRCGCEVGPLCRGA